MLGERLRQARLAAGLSLQGLADRLERPITRQALSRYETGASQPSPTRIADLAAALNVQPSSLLTESSVEIRWEAYRKLAKLSKSRQEQLTALAVQRLEGELRLRELFHLSDRHDLPGPIEVRDLSDCDYAAAAVRMRWNLGDRPVDSLIDLIEEHGGAVVALSEEWGLRRPLGLGEPDAGSRAERGDSTRPTPAECGARNRPSRDEEHRRRQAGRTVRIPLCGIVPRAAGGGAPGTRRPPTELGSFRARPFSSSAGV